MGYRRKNDSEEEKIMKKNENMPIITALYNFRSLIKLINFPLISIPSPCSAINSHKIVTSVTRRCHCSSLQ